MAEPDAATHALFLVYVPQMVHPSFYLLTFSFWYFLKVKIIKLDFLAVFSYKLFFFFSGLSNTFTGKSNYHCHVSAYEKSFPIKPVPSPSWSGSCRRNLLSPKKTQRRHVSTAEEVRKTCNKRC